jgi:anti-anti-sigma factor
MTDIQATTPPGCLAIELEPDRDRVIVRPVGEIDIATVHQLEREILDLIDRGFDSLILDLSSLRFIDGRGMRCVYDLAQSLGDGLVVWPGPRAVQRAFEVSGFMPLIPFERPRRRFSRHP